MRAIVAAGLVGMGLGALLALGGVVHAQGQGRRPLGGTSTYFTWRGPSEQPWLVITSYDPGDPRHDTATLMQPDGQHDLCVLHEVQDGLPPEVACRSTADVARWLEGRR